jgi:hypothetical protein
LQVDIAEAGRHGEYAMIKRICASSVFALACLNASAYEIGAHAFVTNEAFNRSVLADTGANSVFARLGFDRLDAARPFQSPFVQVFNPADGTVFTGEGYWDLVPQSGGFDLVPRDPYTAFERHWINLLLKNDKLPPAGVINNDGLLVYKLQGWMARGALREDDLALGSHEDYDNDSLGNFYRVLNHFYDPVHNVGIGAVVGASTCVGLQPCYRAIDWATGQVDALAVAPQFDTQSRNHYNWESAREAEFRALTSIRDHDANGTYDASDARADSEERYEMWSTTFRALGDVLHLIQDMAQPQHTRQDIHSPYNAAARQTYEAFTDMRVIRDFDPNSDNNKTSILRNIDGGFPAQGYVQQPYLGTGAQAYPTVSFATLREYFTSQPSGLPGGYNPSVAELLGRRGMADFSNRTFFTEDTLPSVFASYALPPSDLGDSAYSLQPVAGSLWVNNQKVVYTQLTRAVTDAVAPSYVDLVSQKYGGKIPLLTVGAWYDFSLLYSSVETAFNLDLYNYTAMADVLLPRAVAYSTGALNYFFRGKIAITLPPAGIYAIFDHSQTHTVDADGYPRDTNGNIFGFTQVQMNVLNATAPITESGSGITVNQRMTNGQLVAVARYHRNQCYKPDLSGELAEDYGSGQMYPPAGCDLIANRTAYQEISVSAPLSVDASGDITVGGQPYDLNGTTPILALFDFSADPIPVNATDLFLQVVYRGNMGDTVGGVPMIEPDAIAVGTVDVSEPTYGAVFNEDYFLYYTQWLTAAQAQPLVPPGTNVDAAPLVNVQYCIDDRLVGEKGQTNQPTGGLQPARQIRYAAILDISQSHTHTDIAQFWINGQPDTQVLIVNAPVFQRDAQASMEQDPLTGPGAYSPDAQTWGRGVVWGSWNTSFYQGYNATVVTAYPQNAPLPSGFLPDPSDAVYLNHPDAALCNQQGNRARQLPIRARNVDVSAADE